jgi:hypothetical protein
VPGSILSDGGSVPRQFLKAFPDKEKIMVPELTPVMMFMNFLILLTGFTITFCIKRLKRLPHG